MIRLAPGYAAAYPPRGRPAPVGLCRGDLLRIAGKLRDRVTDHLDGEAGSAKSLPFDTTQRQSVSHYWRLAKLEEHESAVTFPPPLP